jgi:serine/threonine-protein kinase
MLEGPMSEMPDEYLRRVPEQLDRILSSVTFSGSERHRRFLQFVVEQALKGDTDKLNEFVVGFEVFHKNESFDPRIDSIVRVEVRRLRERLKKYYEEEGQADPIVITIRPRSFVPVFTEAAVAASVDGSEAAAPARVSWRERLPSRRTWLLAASAILCGAAGTALFFTFWWKPPAPPRMASILILPFHTLSGQELLGDGVADSLITGLAGIPGLRVIARGSGIQIQQAGTPPARLATDLNIDYLVDGSVQTRNGKVVVSAKMTDTRSQSYVWAETRECAPEKLSGLEQELTAAIAARIRLPRPPPGVRPERRRAANWEAYALFLKAQYQWYQMDRGGLEKAAALFEQAVQGDPGYAPAWAWLAQSYHLMALRNEGQDPALVAKGRQAAAKAMALDDQLAEAHDAAGSYSTLDWEWAAAEKSFRRAVELNPDWAHGHLLYSLLYLAPTGRTKEAAAEAFRARELDPLTQITRFLGTEVLYFNRDYSHALAEAEDLRKPAGGPTPADRVYFLSLSHLGQGKRALEEMRRAAQPADDLSPNAPTYGYLLAKQGDVQAARAVRQRLLHPPDKRYVSPVWVAMVSTALGDNDATFDQLRMAVRQHVPSAWQVAVEPAFDSLRSDPRYSEIVRAMGLKP